MMMRLDLLVLMSTFATAATALSSFGGVNHFFLASLKPAQRDSVIDKIVGGGAKVIRTFVRPQLYPSEKGNQLLSTSPDIEQPLGNFTKPLGEFLDKYDDMLYSIYKRSSGKTKVILSLHDANMIAGKEDIKPDVYTKPCDAYCQYMASREMPWRSFYTDPILRKAFKARLSQILTKYRSKNFNGRPWRSLSEVILAIDLQNEPGVGSPSAALGGWICDIATYLKTEVRLKKNIGVATGGIGGSNGADPLAGPNWPQEVFDCGSVDIVSLHGYFTRPADQPWCDLLKPGGVLVRKARSYGKLLMVEEWAYNGGAGAKGGDIQAQGHVLNALGIAWAYWDVMSGSEGCSACDPPEVSVDNGTSFSVLKSLMVEAYGSTTVFNWTKYFAPNYKALPISDRVCSVAPGTSPPPPIASVCDKCNVPIALGGCKCDNNCDCLTSSKGTTPPPPITSVCDKCNLPIALGGCKCDNKCDCLP